MYVCFCICVSKQIDLRKLRFYHAKHITTSVGGTDGIVWHALIATSKRMVDILMVEYGIFNFATDAVYLGAIWSKFALELLL